MSSSDQADPRDPSDSGLLHSKPREVTPKPRVIADYAAQSNRGLVRESNEDQYHIVRFGRFIEPLASSIPVERRESLFEEEGFGLIVADGMGGANAGEVASEMAVLTLANLARSTPDWIFSNEGMDLERVSERMTNRFRSINEALVAHAEKNPDLEGMGTTMTVAVIFGAVMLVVHVGDSRAYLYRSGRLLRLTRDHTVAQEMIDAGILPLREDLPERWRHALTRVLGGIGEFEDADLEQLRLADKDKILLCTDGLTGMVGEDLIASILGRATTAQEASDELIAAALEGGGRDNVTVAIAHYSLPSSAPAEPSQGRSETPG